MECVSFGAVGFWDNPPLTEMVSSDGANHRCSRRTKGLGPLVPDHHSLKIEELMSLNEQHFFNLRSQGFGARKLGIKTRLKAWSHSLRVQGGTDLGVEGEDVQQRVGGGRARGGRWRERAPCARGDGADEAVAAWTHTEWCGVASEQLSTRDAVSRLMGG
eukprot:CAMPEP_0174371266 /NCGR_PEP_ID=MMETSP0811_2-20130205/99158_1 /TAXON_ID=73025 ORGANISM="Eutreptiella gymnastica-like, Strain CCMP1594" /NCGR_SAMPLE_ID=MMETSP0811_2 /ASSEMBLY_ACC=CAM_ASM_000667 /LENGTH=159 /DNA_ID=CAMNT_0015517499 /DNA_START=292 /DNA_END=772 /DNA_ORIENTATION=-